MPKQKQLISVLSVRGKSPDRTAYLRNKIHFLETTISRAVRELNEALWITFSLDKISLHKLKKIVRPLAGASLSYFVVEYLSTMMSQALTQSDENDFIFKFLIATLILGNSATHRVTEKKSSFTAEATELLAIPYLYSSTFRASMKITEGLFSYNNALLSSLSTSAFVVPFGISYMAQKYQKYVLEHQYKQGAQRSDTALISSGRSPVANSFFLTNRILSEELFSISRAFQLGLIGNNIINDRSLTRQFRNVPAIVVDGVPQVTHKLAIQLKKVNDDYKINTTIQYILDTKSGFLNKIKRYKLRSGDFLWCHENFDRLRVPAAGTVHAFSGNKDKGFQVSSPISLDFAVNLKAYNGEDVRLKFKTGQRIETEIKEIDQAAIQHGTQIGILDGAEIDFLDNHTNFFIRIARKKELVLDNSYEKKSVINQIISEHKNRNIRYAFVASLISAIFTASRNGIASIPASTIKFLFSLYQITIPFSESFLREMVNGKMMKELNTRLKDKPMDTVDALRLVDFIHAFSGYSADKFPKGVVIISDKTGTLTTPNMKVRGFWTSDMKPNVLVDEQKCMLLDDSRNSFEVFASAYTCSDKNQELEEDAILEQYKQIFTQDCLKSEIVSANRFIKTVTINDKVSKIETFHLGLYTDFGGRFTLVDDKQKYLVFCGIPKEGKFKDSKLLASYTTMQVRTGVLSRDWCIARTPISDELFSALAKLFVEKNKAEIAHVINADICKTFSHICTFLIDNPVKKGVEDFISNCKSISAPVIVATGDTQTAATNIACVLCRGQVEKIILIKATDKTPTVIPINLAKATVIFAGINDAILKQLGNLMSLGEINRPNIIFAEMSKEDKGILAKYFKKQGYFVVANGDGTNDVAMMKVADFVITHLASDGTYAPRIEQYSNLNDEQVRRLCKSTNSFYQNVDVHRGDESEFISHFIRLANAQEMVSYALGFKSIKMSFELVNAFGGQVKEIWQQQWFSILFDAIWQWISFKKIDEYADFPVDDKHLGVSNLPLQCMVATVALAVLEAVFCYATLDQSTDITFMIAMLSFLPMVLSSLFSGFKNVENEEVAELKHSPRLFKRYDRELEVKTSERPAACPRH